MTSDQEVYRLVFKCITDGLDVSTALKALSGDAYGLGLVNSTAASACKEVHLDLAARWLQEQLGLNRTEHTSEEVLCRIGAVLAHQLNGCLSGYAANEILRIVNLRMRRAATWAARSLPSTSAASGDLKQLFRGVEPDPRTVALIQAMCRLHSWGKLQPVSTTRIKQGQAWKGAVLLGAGKGGCLELTQWLLGGFTWSGAAVAPAVAYSAAETQSSELLNELLTTPNIQFKDVDLEGALTKAVQAGASCSVLKLLLRAARWNMRAAKPALVAAVADYNRDAVCLLLEAFSWQAADLQASLEAAAVGGDRFLLALLLQHGQGWVRGNLVGAKGKAIKNGHVRVVRMLLRQPAGLWSIQETAEAMEKVRAVSSTNAWFYKAQIDLNAAYLAARAATEAAAGHGGLYVDNSKALVPWMPVM